MNHIYTACPRFGSRALALVLAALSLGTAGCGRQAFETAKTNVSTVAPGTYSIAPKVDLLLVTDDTGSTSTVYGQIQTQVTDFINRIGSSGWDYHFASIPLTQFQAINQVLASRFDANWNQFGMWTQPYPGAVANLNSSDTVIPSAFRTVGTYPGPMFSAFVNNINYAAGGKEAGLQNIAAALTNASAKSTHFLRKDATLAVILIGNGDDTSGITYCDDGANYGQVRSVRYVACEQAALQTGLGARGWCYNSSNAGYDQCSSTALTQAPKTRDSSYQDFRNQIISAKGGQNVVRFFSAVAQNSSNSCLGAVAYRGSRYIQLAADLGGTSYDVCSTPLSTILSDVGQRLQSIQMAFIKRYLFIPKAPNITTIRVYRQINGDPNNTVEIAQDGSNGWTYSGQGTFNEIEAVDFTGAITYLNPTSGFAIRLNGASALVGSDTARVDYVEAGLQPSF